MENQSHTSDAKSQLSEHQGNNTILVKAGVCVLAVVVLYLVVFSHNKPDSSAKKLTIIHHADNFKIPKNEQDTQPTADVAYKSSKPLPKHLPRPSESVFEKNLIKLEATQDMARLRSPSSVVESNRKPNLLQQTQPSEYVNDENLLFAKQLANAGVSVVKANKHSKTEYKIFQGKIIPAVLETAINSDLPGMLRASITQDVYGESGEQLLLPRGSRLIGHYSSKIQTGQKRVYIIWSRAITPQHVDIALGSPGIDHLGRAGMSGDVDNHFMEIFGTSALLSLMALGSSLPSLGGKNDGLDGNAFQSAVTESFVDSSNQVMSDKRNIKPTIYVDQGTLLKVIVAKDLDFSTVATR